MIKSLIIDDDQEFIENLKSQFESLNFDIFSFDSCNDGVTGINFVESK